MFITTVTPSIAGNTYLGWGAVNMQGAIVDTACAIAIESQDQSIDMDIVPVSDINRDGQGRAKPFSIELVNCVVERQEGRKADWKQFQITFDGDAEGDLFGVRGEASGVALQITDKGGNIVAPGRPLPREDITSENMRLNYYISLVANQHTLKVGEYFSAVRFKLDYF
ncbi:fimbrial protein [Serratia marcescens]|uniref:fimbrial protein n=1 Tax=Serratia TaxID=613 RepID=UPI003BA1F480